MALTQPIATVIQGLLTAAAAIGGIVLARLLLASKVRDLQTALDRSQEAVDRHALAVEKRLASIETRFGTFDDRLGSVDEQLGANLLSVNSVRGTVEDIEAAQAAGLEENELATPSPDAVPVPTRATLVAAWSAIRDRLEAIAADAGLDGRQRAALARVDRRNYHDLIAALDQRGMLPGSVTDFTKAAHLRYANHARFQGPQAAAEMVRLRELLAPEVTPG